VEVVNSPSDQSGVWGVDLSSCEESPADYIIILGSVEVTGRPSLTNSLSKERRGFFSSLGFYFSPPLKNKNDFIIEWLLTGERKEIIISNPKADSNGRSVSASPWWIKAAALQKRDLEHLDSAKETQWLHIQRAILNPDVDQKIDEFKNLPSEFTVSLASRLNLELQGLRTIELTPHHGKPFNLALSASHLEAYWECPFKFFARRHLNLFDEADLEVEPSPQVRGQWLHKAVEKIVSDERGLDQWTDEDLILLIDSLDKDQKKISSDVWPNIRSRFLRQIKRFIAYERDWQKYHPRIKPKHFEASINGFLKWNENEPASVTFETGEFSVPFRGSIDRIDVTADNKAIILDYKSSSSTASKNIGSWAKAGSFQLALYTLSTEAGLLEGGTYPVLAAQYYSLRRLEREKGFRLTDVDLSGILPESKSKSRVDLLQRNESFTEIKLEIHRILENIRLGKMTPKPHDEKLCVTCNWKNICRAPHLS
jgi:ATP-dependent helicase/DNAse subunit B